MTIEPLDWFPKRFSPGDMDGTGGDRLLGRSRLSPLEILIRETAQNSWDARLPGAVPEYGVRYRRTTPRMRSDLAKLLQNDRTMDLGSRSMDQRLRLLEVYDRGTAGLDGPVDLRPVRGGGSTNYQDLILKIGVATHEGTGGGTYGFGKTAAFAYSQVGTVIYWTRCRAGEGGFEHRFVVSAIRSSYSRDDAQYTGRHWWGVLDGESVLPVTGSRAEALGAAFFERGFLGEETGTSVLVIDPYPVVDPTDEEESPSLDNDTQDRLFAQQAREAIRMNLWPKLIPRPGRETVPMRLSLEVDGHAVPLVDGSAGVIELWGTALSALRSAEEEQAVPTTGPSGARVEIIPITRWGRLLGRLALVRYARGLFASAGDELDPAAERGRVDRICLMRNQAELVVTTATWFDRVIDDDIEWLAVYKPVKEWDPIYAASEPPAHDDWVSSGAEDDVAKIVRFTQRKVKEALSAALSPQTGPTGSRNEGQQMDAGNLARRLSSLLPAPAEQVTVGGRGSSRPSGRRAARRAEVVAAPPYLVDTAPDGSQHQRIGFRVSGPNPEATVLLEVSQVGDQGVREPIPPGLLGIRWDGNARPTGLCEARAATGGDCWVEFHGPARRALRIELRAVGA